MAPLRSEASATGSRTTILTIVILGQLLVGLVTIAHFGLDAVGSDFACFWAGAKTALHDPHRLYDFEYVTGLQGWPFGPTKIRPFIYPPSSLPLFIPFALAPYWVGYGLWAGLTGALFLWAGRRAGAPWWHILLAPVLFAAFCGQTTLLIGGLVIAGLAYLGPRPLVAGLLFGIAAAVKPQLVVLVPIALVAEGRWRTLVAAGCATGGLAAASLAAWGLTPWLEWLSALQRFQGMIFNDVVMVRSAITPYAALQLLGLDGAWAFLLAPLAPVAVWIVFRRTQDLADRSLAIFAGALLVSPYAMNYEAALLAPAVATYLARTGDRRWFGYALCGTLSTALAVGFAAPLSAVALPLVRRYRSGPAGPT